MSPTRVQLSRQKGWRKPPGTIVVSRPSRWGNPFRPADYPDLPNDLEARRRAAGDFARALASGKLPFTIVDVRRELAGKDLACWCPPTPPGEPDACHADVLLRLANTSE